MFRYLFLLVITFHLANCFVLKVKNYNSDVVAPEHKVPPIEPQTLDASDKIRRFEIKKRADDEDVNENQKLRRNIKPFSSQQSVSMINQAFEALKKTIAQPEFRASKTMTFIDRVLETLKEIVNGPEFRRSKTMRYIEKIIDIVKEAANGPEYRSGGQPNMRTDMVHFEGGQPSLMFELKPDFFKDVLKKILSTRLVERYMDDLANDQRRPKKYKSRYQ